MAGRFPLLRDYEVLAEVGRGTLGNVYKALHHRTHELVAIKRIETSSPALRARVHRSFQAAAAIAHPGCVTLHELVEEPAAVSIASELVEGPDLFTFLEPPVARDRARVKRAFFILGQVLKALAAIHAGGLVHGGLKPRNLLVGRGGRLKVTDIGLSREWDFSSTETLPVDVDRLSAYYAPEQVLGEPCDARSDLYAFGLLLYETLSGKKPHQGPSLLLQVQARTTSPPLPLQVGEARIEQAFGPLLDRLLSPAREERPASAEEALAALKAAWEGLDPGQPEGSDAMPSGGRVPPEQGPSRAAESARTHASTSELRISDLRVHEVLSGGDPEVLDRVTGPPLVGREALMDRLVRELDLAASGSATLLALGGEAGAGKTRLLAELAAATRRKGGIALAGRAWGGADPERGPLASLLDDLARRLEVLAPPERHTLVPEGSREALASLSPGFRRLLGLDARALPSPRAAAADLLDALVSLLTRIAGDSLVCLGLEDVEASDALSLALLGDLTRALLDRPRGSRVHVLPVVTFRSDTIGADHPFLRAMAELSDQGHADRVDVPRLDETSAFQLASFVLGLDPLPSLLRSVIWRRTNGNPLFVLETASQMRGGPLLNLREAAPSLDPLSGADDDGKPAWPVPERIQEVLDERMARLSAEARALLPAIAISGGELEVERLREDAAPGLPDRGPWAPLTELRNASLLLAVPGRPGVYRLDPGPLADRLVEALAPAERSSLAARVARALERSPRTGPAQAPLLATLYAASGDTERLRASLPAAARSLVATRDLRGAIRLWRQLVEVSAPGEEARRARGEVAALHLALGEVAAAAAAYREQLAGDGAAADPEEHLATLLGLAQASLRSGDLTAAELHAAEAAERARALRSGSFEARALECLGAVARRRVDRERARDRLGRALELHRSHGDPRGVARVLVELASPPFSEDDPAAARARLDEALLEEHAGDGSGRAAALVALGSLALHTLDLAPALSRIGEALALEEHALDGRSRALVRTALAEAYLADGDYRLALERFEQALRTLAALGDANGAARALVGLGQTYARTNNALEAVRRLEGAVFRLESVEDPLLECEARTALAEAVEETGDRRRATAEATRAVAIAEAHGASGRLVTARLVLARLVRSVEEAERALTLAHTLHDERLLLRCHHELARIEVGLGDREAARAHLRLALAIVNAIADGRGSDRDAFLRVPEIEAVLRDARRE